MTGVSVVPGISEFLRATRPRGHLHGLALQHSFDIEQVTRNVLTSRLRFETSARGHPEVPDFTGRSDIRHIRKSRKARTVVAPPALPGRHQGRRHRRRWRQRHQPDDRGRPQASSSSPSTPTQALLMSDADVKLDGRELTRGPVAGADPEVWRRAAEDHAEEIGKKSPAGADMVFVTAGEAAAPASAVRRSSPRSPGPRRLDHRCRRVRSPSRAAVVRTRPRRHRIAARRSRHADRHPQRSAAVDQRPVGLDARCLPAAPTRVLLSGVQGITDPGSPPRSDKPSTSPTSSP